MATATSNALFPWQPEYSVGVIEIDEQHKRLLDLLNRLQEAMAGGRGRQALGPIVSELVLYTERHFATEERLMRAHQYPDFEAHRKEHETLTRTVQEFLKEFETNKLAMTVRVMQFLKNWLISHILNTDKKYVSHFAARGLH